MPVRIEQDRRPDRRGRGCQKRSHHSTGWREARLELDRYIAEYGQLPEWQHWLSELTQFVNAGPSLVNLTPQQRSNPKGLRSWLTPGAMWRYGVSPSSPLTPTKAFLKYLDDYFYIDLSADPSRSVGNGQEDGVIRLTQPPTKQQPLLKRICAR
jgi:hypothetical protein